MKLLTRTQFKERVFSRDKHLCVMCDKSAKDAHHVIERRLWPDSGYYLDNGVSVCELHHIEAEQTTLSCTELREAAGIEKIVLPPHFYDDENIDKWGNTIMPNGTRARGELFFDESVQKILKQGNQLDLFTRYVKYPRTYHLPWSPARKNKDERTSQSTEQFEDQDVIVFVKMDGENTTWYSDYIHARSLDYSPHESRNLVKKMHGEVAWQLPDNWRLCGENVYAKHSIHYKHLEDFFYVFSIWNEKNQCLPWDETLEWIELLGLTACPTIYEGPWDEKLIRNLVIGSHNDDECEEYVIRPRAGYDFKDFRRCNVKAVRADHVQTHAFWRQQQVVPNELRKKL